MSTNLPDIVLIIDGPDPDNYAALMACLSDTMPFNLSAVIMTGRPVSARMPAPHPSAFNPNASRAVRRDNALHGKGILTRHAGGRDIPVFEGGRAPYSTIPHDKHIHERFTDVFDDMHAGHSLAGDIDDAVAFIATLNGPVHFICGGPMTDLAYLMRQPMLRGKLGKVAAQLGMFGINPRVETIAGKRRQFNVLADVAAARDVLLHYPGQLLMIPTDVTKDPRFAFENASEVARLSSSSAGKELAAMYEQAWPHMWGPLGIPAHLHDFHPVVAMRSWLGDGLQDSGRVGSYVLEAAEIVHVPHLLDEEDEWGRVDIKRTQLSGTDNRLVAVDITDTRSLHHWRLTEVLNTIWSSSSLQMQMVR